VTDRHQREEEALKIHERLTRVAQLSTMGEMSASVAHELNQPLAAITAYARACERQLSNSTPDYQEVLEAVREIAAEGMRAGEIIRRLRQLARSDAGERRVSDINALIREVHPLIDADVRAHGARLRLSLAPDLPGVEVDSVQIQQVLLNLVRNALQAVDDSPAVTHVVGIVTGVHDGDVEFRVVDNGPGIAPEMSTRLFEAFCTTKASGTGLGLAISRTIVHAHKGTIGSVQAEPHGAEFFVRLPAVVGSDF
jgi:two-component system sensor kinase FixL